MHILIIDDEADIREIAKISLEITQHWQISLAATGQTGVEMAIAQKPNVILLDVIMPGVNGLDTLRLLKSTVETAEIPIILLTATTKLAIQDPHLLEGIAGIIIKPFDPGTLGEQIQALIRTAVTH